MTKLLGLGKQLCMFLGREKQPFLITLCLTVLQLGGKSRGLGEQSYLEEK